jgi:signal transduction histidine kinase/DNA-binding response OmpR family regulator/ligand-binding sensor domain-containing protein
MGVAESIKTKNIIHENISDNTSEHYELKKVENFSPSDYEFYRQNFSIISNQENLLFFGNLGGLLIYDGVSWRKFVIPNNLVRSLAMDSSGRLYIGGDNEFGYLICNSQGQLEYISLIDKLPKAMRYFSEVWDIRSGEFGICFRTSKYLLVLAHEKMEIIESQTIFNGSFLWNNSLIIAEKDGGFFVLKDGKKMPLTPWQPLMGKKVFMVEAWDSSTALIGTRQGDFYLYDDHYQLSDFKLEFSDQLALAMPYKGIILKNGDLAVATLRGGVFFYSHFGKLKSLYNKKKGLLDDDVKYIYQDCFGNIWLALNSGIAKIEYASPFVFYGSKNNIEGMSLSISRFKGIIYVGTSQGLFCSKVGSHSFTDFNQRVEFNKIEQIEPICWAVEPFHDQLIAASDRGVFQINDRSINSLLTIPSFVLVSSKQRPCLFIGTSFGLACLFKDQGKIRSHTFNNIPYVVRSIVEMPDATLWLGTYSQGVIHVSFFDNKTNCGLIVNQVNEYGSRHGLPQGEVNVFLIDNQAVFATGKGLYYFNDQNKVFAPYERIHQSFAGGHQGVFRMFQQQSGQIWIHSESRNYCAQRMASGVFALVVKPFCRLPLIQVNAILPEKKWVWFAGDEGLIKYHLSDENSYHDSFQTLIRRVSTNQNEILFSGHKNPNKTGKPLIINAHQNNLRFEYAAPFYINEKMSMYQCVLEGNDKQWSTWAKETQKDYTNLAAGFYVFKVRSKNTFDNLGSEDCFSFKLLSPWYLAWPMMIIYGLLIIAVLFFMIKWRFRYLEKEKAQLEKMIVERTLEITRKNQQLQEQTQTLLIQSDKIREMDLVKSRFFANISHEFRTPLTLIMGPMEQMLKSVRNLNDKKILSVMYRNSAKLLYLINQLLDLSKFDSGQMKLNVSGENIVSFIRGILSCFEFSAQKKGVKLFLKTNQNDINIAFDSEKMEKVFFNLLSNAIKFTPAGGRVSVSLNSDSSTLQSQAGSYLEIQIKDTGKGIPADTLERVFDRFFQGQENYGISNKGTGIGLALAKEIIILHQGKIFVESVLDKGSTFTILLPVDQENFLTGHLVKAQSQPAADREQCIRSVLSADEDPFIETNTDKQYQRDIILIVEDNSDMRYYIRQALEPIYRVMEAENGLNGAAIAKKTIPDIIISDIMMPKKDGFEMCLELKQHRKTSHIPIILLTAKVSDHSVIKGLENGADDYLTKPFSTKILLARIKNLIEQRKQLQQKIKEELMLEPPKISASSVDQQFLNELLQVIEQHLPEPEFNVDNLAKTMIMGRTSLFRKIKALTGDSPVEFIRSYRLKRAMQLIVAKHGNITEIAFQVGFSDTSYFSKCFKKKFKNPPSFYMENSEQNPAENLLIDVLKI